MKSTFSTWQCQEYLGSWKGLLALVSLAHDNIKNSWKGLLTLVSSAHDNVKKSWKGLLALVSSAHDNVKKSWKGPLVSSLFSTWKCKEC